MISKLCLLAVYIWLYIQFGELLLLLLNLLMKYVRNQSRQIMTLHFECVSESKIT